MEPNKQNNIKIPIGLPPPVDMTYKVGNSMDARILEREASLAKLICYICKRHIGDRNLIDLGLPFRVCATEITEEERQIESEHQKVVNNEKKAKEVSGENPDNLPEITEYNPYRASPKPTDSVKPLICDGRRHYIKIQTLPAGVYLCNNCRRVGETGSQTEPNGSHPQFQNIFIPNPHYRNIINKFQQRECGITYYRDTKRWWPITDCLHIIHGNVNLPLLYQQFQISLGMENTPLSTKQHTEIIRYLLAPIMREFIDNMFKTTSPCIEVYDIADFEMSFCSFLKIYRIALELVHRFPDVQQQLMQDVLIWNMNPFEKTGQNYFFHLIDVLIVLPLTGLDFGVIKRQFVMALFNQMLYHFDVKDEQLALKNKVTYLRQLFNEGRNRKLARMMLYTNCFLSFATNKDPRSLIEEMNAYYCNLPFDTCIDVWKQMQLCNESVVGLYPSIDEESGNLRPGLMMYLGLTDPKAELRKHVDNIYEFIMWVRRNQKKWTEVPMPPGIDAIIKRISENSAPRSNIITRSLRTMHANLTERETKRYKELAEIHRDYVPPPHPVHGAPRLRDLVCAYPLCGASFSSIRDLKKHLEEAGKVINNSTNEHRHILGYSLYYNDAYTEDAYRKRELDPPLTPERVLREGIVVCPALVCPAERVPFPSPEHLCDHIASFGLTPFWKPGWKPMCIEPELAQVSEGAPNLEVVEEIQKIHNPWENPGDCIVCMEHAVSSILVPCFHAALCMNCVDILCSTSHKQCPYCRTKFTSVLPLNFEYIGDLPVFFMN